VTVRRVNIDDTSRCPHVDLCQTCGQRRDLALSTVQTPLGVCCTTLCRQCTELGLLPRWSAAQAARWVGEHCEHLGIDLDDMAAELGSDRDG
jgi:hypothetical protein